MDFLYKNWAKIGAIGGLALTSILLIVPNLGSVTWFLWVNLLLYLVHQFEEHIYPGHFKEMLNQTLAKDPDGNFPANERNVFFINVFYIWILIPVSILLKPVSPIFPLMMVFFIVVNCFSHIFIGILKRKYNPGLLASLLVNLPIAGFTVYLFLINELADIPIVILSLVLGFLLHATMLVFFMVKMKLRKAKNGSAL